jgi:hypothetical protein
MLERGVFVICVEAEQPINNTNGQRRKILNGVFRIVGPMIQFDATLLRLKNKQAREF